mgnify:FL=1
MDPLSGCLPHWEKQLAAARREGVIEGLQQACGLLLATVPEDALVHIRAEIERLKGERP